MVKQTIHLPLFIGVAGLLLACLSACRKNTDDISAYRKVEQAGVATPKLVNPDFADGTSGWRTGEGFSSAPGQGFNSTGALFYERTNPESYALATQDIVLSPGVSYKFSALIRSEGVQGGDERGATIAMQFFKGGKYIGGSFPPGVKGTTDWTQVELASTIPDEADTCQVLLYMRKGLTGKAWFAKAKIEPVNRPAEAHLLRPVQERFLTNDGHFALRWDLPGDGNKEMDGKSLQSRVEIRSGDKLVKLERFPCTGLVTKGDLGSLPVGELTFRAALLDPEAKTILHEAEFPVTCVNPANIPANAVRVDAKGRTYVDGKPFMPVGFVLGHVNHSILKDLAGSPFNCVMPYASLSLGFENSSKKGVERTTEVLDACAAANIKVILSIKDLYENATWAGGRINCPPSWNDTKGEKEILTAVIENFRNHPALIAWYTADEMSASYAPRLTERRRLVRKLDPWHPTWAINCTPQEIGRMSTVTDVTGIDPYPINKIDSNDMAAVDHFASKTQAALAGDGQGLPLWVMPQAHNTGLYQMVDGRRFDRAEDREKLLAKYRAPSEEEMRSMSLLMAIQGARGFVFYSYYDQIKPAVLTDFPKRWKELCNVGALLQELRPFLYSDEKAPQLTVKTIKGKIHAAAYKAADGKVKVLVTGTGPGESEAEITLAGTANLKSRYGKTESLGSGDYRFKGTDICSDVLE
jgi:hypothetical protein